MRKYNADNFRDAIMEKFNGQIITCPFCGGRNFTTTQSFVALPIAEDLQTINLGPNIPCGIIVCQNCGHVDMFALGTLNLLENMKGEENAEKK